MSDCAVCGTPDSDKPMCYKGENYCSENHRKVIAGEKPPNFKEQGTMTNDLFKKLALGNRCR